MLTLGLDEVGRGCWAGPLVAAAVIMPSKPLWEDSPPKVAPTLVGLRDSKKLSRLQRTKLDREIRSQAKAYGVGWVTPGEIDSLGLTDAVRLAMLRAIAELHKTCTTYDEIIIDGTYNFLAECESSALSHAAVRERSFHRVRTMVGADGKVPAVSAASIVAKVARDNYMGAIDAQYPQYGFDRHVGYGTLAHRMALQQYGVTDIHRRSFAPVKIYI